MVEELLKVRVYGINDAVPLPPLIEANFASVGFCGHHLQAGADVNLPNNVGDTPLHKAAFTGRKVRRRDFEIAALSTG